MPDYRIHLHALAATGALLVLALSAVPAMACMSAAQIDAATDAVQSDIPHPAVAQPDATVPAAASAALVRIAGFGAAMESTLLDNQRGGSDLGPAQPLGGILSTGVVGDNRAIDVATGSNAIRDGAFTNASGIPVVIQNTGANVLIQNATIVNLQLH